MPREAEHVLAWFYDLCGLHTSGMAVNPLQPSEIAAYFRLVAEEPTPWEIRTLLRMDRAFLDRVAKPKQKAGQVDVNDVEGVRAILASFRGRKPKKRGGLKKIEVAKDE